jgi:lipopolysaccharide transport system ATP-binding protein
MGAIDSVIHVDNLSKHYEIGVQQKSRHQTAREALVDACAQTWRGLRRISRGKRREKPAESSFWALKDVSFDVRQGEVVGIVGRNGAGKSTLLKILSRIVEPTAGRAVVRGRVGSLLEVGTGFHPDLTGRENVYLNGAILGMARAEIARKFDDIVGFAELQKFIDTPVKRYSSGMYVRLAFAVAAHLEPEILIVDEVLSVGDATFQDKCMGTMQRTASSGRTILYVSHNLASIQQLCTRAIMLRQGKVVAEGTPHDIVRGYLADVKTLKKVSVRDWPDRAGTGEARIIDLEVTDENGTPSDNVLFGRDLRFTIVADFHEPVLDPVFGLLIYSMGGEPLLDVRSWHSGLRLGRVKGRIAIEGTVPMLGAYPGEYLLSPFVAAAGCREDIDWVKLCQILRVHPAPGPYGDLKLDPTIGKYWTPSKWTVQDRSPESAPQEDQADSRPLATASERR